MKNFFTFLLVSVLLLALTSCVNNSTDTTDTTGSEENIAYDKISLVTAYCSGEWDGAFISNSEHCASVEDGMLWLDSVSTEQVADMGPYADCSWIDIVDSSIDGTWTIDRKSHIVECWVRGIRHKKIYVGDANSIYKLDNCLAARHGALLELYSLEGQKIVSIEDIIDVCQTDDTILYSTFDHKNFSILPDGKIETLDSSMVRFPRENVKVENYKSSLDLEKISNQYYNTDWNGETRIVDGNFVAIDYSGKIVINNKVEGIASLGGRISSEAANLSFTAQKTYYLDGNGLKTFEKGLEKSFVDLPDGPGQILWIDKYGVVVHITECDILIIIRPDGETITLSSCVLDAHVASDTIYFMEGDVVFAADWQKEWFKPELFFEGAYAVSHFSDEAEGAIVPYEDSNYTQYGYNNLYSPYGN